jgi:hypothetical protein
VEEICGGSDGAAARKVLFASHEVQRAMMLTLQQLPGGISPVMAMTEQSEEDETMITQLVRHHIVIRLQMLC